MRRHLTALAATMASLALLTACTPKDDDMSLFSWDGSEDFSDRQTIEQFRATMETAVGDYVEQMEPLSGSTSVLERSKLTPCGNARGYQFTTAIVAFDPPTDRAGAFDRAAATFEHLGLTFEETSSDTRQWLDLANGGHITVTLAAHDSVTIYASSGCRPTDGTTDPANPGIPDWEAALPTDPHYIQSGS